MKGCLKVKTGFNNTGHAIHPNKYHKAYSGLKMLMM